MNDELKERVKAQEKPPQWFVLLKSVASCENEDVMMHMDGSMTIKPDCMERFAQAVARDCASEVESSAAIIDHPSCYMGGPSNGATRKAAQIADAIRARYGLAG